MRSIDGNVSYGRNHAYQALPTDPARSQQGAPFDKFIFDIAQSSSFNMNSDRYGNPLFIRRLGTHLIEGTFGVSSLQNLEWQYDSRHTAQAILPFLFLGPGSVARDEQFIKEHNITMVISVRDANLVFRYPSLHNPSRFKACSGLETRTWDIDGAKDFLPQVASMIKGMNNHLESVEGQVLGEPITDPAQAIGKILVCCETGNYRAPELVAAYLMVVFGLSEVDAVGFIMSKRFSCAIPQAAQVLQTFKELFQATEALTPALMDPDTGLLVQQSQFNALRGVKRRRDEADAGDHAMEVDTDRVPLDKDRRIAPPFRDIEDQ